MFERWQDESNISTARAPKPDQESVVASSRGGSTFQEQAPGRSYSDDPNTHVKIPIEDIDAYLKHMEQSSRQSPASTPNIDLQGILGLVGSLLNSGGPASHASIAAGSENFHDMPNQPSPATTETQPSATTPPVRPRPFGGIGKKTTELIGNQSPRRRVAVVGGVVVAAVAFGLQSHNDTIDQGPIQLTAPASLINQGAVIGSIDMQSRATVRIPVTGFSKPLLFMEMNKPVEPATTLNDTISLTLAPTIDKKGNSLPIATVTNGDTFEVDRTTIDVKATFDNYLGLNIDCAKQATTVTKRFCVAGSPVELKASGNLKATTAKQLNELLTAKGSNFDTYYQGVKAKLAVASLAKLEQGSCGTDISGLADEAIRNLLLKQSTTAQIHFTQNSRYPSISKNYAANFTGLVANKAFSIEQGDSKNAIPNSLQVTCKVNPTNIKGEKK